MSSLGLARRGGRAKTDRRRPGWIIHRAANQPYIVSPKPANSSGTANLPHQLLGPP